MLAVLVHGQRAIAGRDEAEAGRRHQALLRAGHRDVDAPFVHLERHAAERRHGVDHVQRRMAGGADRLADAFDVVEHARGRVDLRHQNGLDLVRPCPARSRASTSSVRTARRQSPLSTSTSAPISLARMAPADRETPALQHQHLVAARQHIGQRAFPGAMAVGDVDVGFVLGGEQIGRDRDAACRRDRSSRRNRCRAPGDASPAALRRACWWGRGWPEIPGPRERSLLFSLLPEHDPEKWVPVFRPDHARIEIWSAIASRSRLDAVTLPNIKLAAGLFRSYRMLGDLHARSDLSARWRAGSASR